MDKTTFEKKMYRRMMDEYIEFRLVELNKSVNEGIALCKKHYPVEAKKIFEKKDHV